LLAERAVEHVADAPPLAIDVYDRLRALDLQVRFHVFERRKPAHLGFHKRRKAVELI
jgi:hypothetical protein